MNMGTGEWRFAQPTPMYAWNPFLSNRPNPQTPPPANNPLLNIPANVEVRTLEYGMISCSLFCAKDVVCPYSQRFPKFNPKLQRSDVFKPMDYIDPAVFRTIQAARDVACVKVGNQYRPPGNAAYCFLCPSEQLSLTPLTGGDDVFNEIVFTTLFGPSVAVLWAILIFEHVVFGIKFIVMAMVCCPLLVHAALRVHRFFCASCSAHLSLVVHAC